MLPARLSKTALTYIDVPGARWVMMRKVAAAGFFGEDWQLRSQQ
jgi:hypothetical protein